MDPYSGGSWTMIPTHNNTPTHSNQDALFLHQQQQQQLLHQHQQQPFQQQQQLQLYQKHHQYQSLASHFHLLHLVENLVEVIEHGTRDQQSDALTVEGQKKLEESEQLLSQQRDLIAKYRNSVEVLIKSEP